MRVDTLATSDSAKVGTGLPTRVLSISNADRSTKLSASLMLDSGCGCWPADAGATGGGGVESRDKGSASWAVWAAATAANGRTGISTGAEEVILAIEADEVKPMVQ